jgi:hypothetical protein
VAVWRSDVPPLRDLVHQHERRVATTYRALYERLLTLDEAEGVHHILATGWAETLRGLAELQAPEVRTMDSLERFETPSGTPVRIAKAVEGRVQRGRLIGYATSASAERLAVVDNGRELIGLATASPDLPAGAQVQATAVRERNRVIRRVDDLERMQGLERGRETGT